MKKTITQAPKQRKKRASKGAGTLYKRDATGKGHPPEWPGKGVFWLAYSVPNPDGGTGKRIRQPLRDADGNPITDRTQAESERRRILAPYAAGTKVEALRSIRAALADAESERAVAVEQATLVLTLADTWEAFERHPNRPKCSERTLAQYEAEFKRFLAWIQREHPDAVAMRDVTRDHAITYAGHLDRAQITPSTFNQHRNLLTMMWRILADHPAARIISNPWEVVQRRKLNKTANRKRALTGQEYGSIMAAAESDPDLRDLFIMLAWTGQRLADMVFLTWGAADFLKGVLTLYPRKTAGRTGQAVYPPLFPAAREVLNRRQDPAKPFKLDALVFPDVAAEYKRDGGSTLVKRIGKIFTAAGLETTATRPGQARAVVQYGAHSFRHYFITQAAAAGMPAAMVKRITGHTTDDMMEHYQQIGEAHSVELARRIGNGNQAALPTAEPLPGWARGKLASMTSKTWKSIRTEMLQA